MKTNSDSDTLPPFDNPGGTAGACISCGRSSPKNECPGEGAPCRHLKA